MRWIHEDRFETKLVQLSSNGVDEGCAELGKMRRNVSSSSHRLTLPRVSAGVVEVEATRGGVRALGGVEAGALQ